MNTRVEFQTQRSALIQAALQGICPRFEAADELNDFMQSVVCQAANLQQLGEQLARLCGPEVEFSQSDDCYHFARISKPQAVFCMAYNPESATWDIALLAQNKYRGELVAPLTNMLVFAESGMVVVLNNEEMALGDVLDQLSGRAVAA